MTNIREIENYKSSFKPIFEKNDVQKAILFGSIGRDTQTRKSDIDLMIIMKTNKRFFNRFDDFNEILSLVRDRSVDMLIYTPEELDKISHRPFIKKILKEGITIYEQ
jgi:predicted nucleotidyltransferase